MSSTADSGSKYLLRWKHRLEQYNTAFTEMLEKQIICDVTVVCEGTIFKAHRFLLAATSQYFKDILQSIVEGQHPVVILCDVSSQEFKYVLDYMYKGETIVPAEMLDTFMETCNRLRVSGLCEAPDDMNSETDCEDDTSDTIALLATGPSDNNQDPATEQCNESLIFEEAEQNCEKDTCVSNSRADRNCVPLVTNDFVALEESNDCVILDSASDEVIDIQNTSGEYEELHLSVSSIDATKQENSDESEIIKWCNGNKKISNSTTRSNEGSNDEISSCNTRKRPPPLSSSSSSDDEKLDLQVKSLRIVLDKNF